MNHAFSIEVLSHSIIHALPDAWSSDDYVSLLDLCDFDGADAVSKDELFEYVAMAMQELDPADAAEIVLKHRLGDRLKAGQIQSMAHDMLEENLWEEYGDMSMHEELFNITSLLYTAFNGKFPHPDAIELVMTIGSKTPDGVQALRSLDESLLARVLAFGQDDHAIINRLFDDKIAGPYFEEAKDIIWKFAIQERAENSVTVHITTALYWAKGLRKGLCYEAKTHNNMP
ncbi:MAG: hypothetical protein RLP15_08210 [Cryomorphaceae bacterium]